MLRTSRFNTYTSEFVVTGNGTYIFHLHVMSQENEDCYAWIMVNKKHQLPVYGDARAGYVHSHRPQQLGYDILMRMFRLHTGMDSAARL